MIIYKLIWRATSRHATIANPFALDCRPPRILSLTSSPWHIYHTQVQELEHTGSVQAPGDQVTAMFQELGEEMEELQVPALYLRCT